VLPSHDLEARPPGSERSAVGSADYYRRRHADFVHRHPHRAAPRYYESFGHRYYARFERLKPDLSPLGQRWVARTGAILQEMLEDLRDCDPRAFAALERDGAALDALAFSTHVDAYREGGFRETSLTDGLKILRTIDVADLLACSSAASSLALAASTIAAQVGRRAGQLLGDGPRDRPWPFPLKMLQRWRDLTFLSWPVARRDLAALRRLVPDELELDLFDGDAWVTVVPFEMRGVALAPLPTLLPPFLQINLRTYVRRAATNERGVYFLSIDCQSPLVTGVARRFFALPYRASWISARARGPAREWTSEHGGAAHFRAALEPQGVPVAPPPDSLERFLVNRGSFFTTFAPGQRLLEGRVCHAPWSVRRAAVELGRNELPEPLGLRLAGPPLHAMSAPGLDVVAHPLAAAP
jgi:uncharacterized protein YqjF (DUF2071 family)